MSAAGLTLAGTLPVGVEVEGVVHRDFVLRPAKVKYNIEAIDLVGSHNNVAVSSAVFAQQLVSLGTLKPEQLTYDLVCDMDPRDFNALDAAAGELAKKALPEPPPKSPGTESGSASAGSGSTG